MTEAEYKTIIGSDNGFSPGWRQAIFCTHAGILLIGPLGLQWNFNRNWYSFIQGNAFENIVWKMVAILSQPQCVISKSYRNLKYQSYGFKSSQNLIRYERFYQISAYLFVFIKLSLATPLELVTTKHILKIIVSQRLVIILIRWTVAQQDILQHQMQNISTGINVLSN